jgi:hypothetical protein
MTVNRHQPSDPEFRSVDESVPPRWWDIRHRFRDHRGERPRKPVGGIFHPQLKMRIRGGGFERVSINRALPAQRKHLL